MGKKIFTTYKYADSQVRPISGIQNTTVRDYVDILQSKLDKSDHIYKGEDDGEDMGSLADSTIGSKLGDKIFDSTVTIVFISKGMKENTPDSEQWIPWEISYSLREQSREGKNSKTNAVLGVVLPDNADSYAYYYRPNPDCNSTTHLTHGLFTILKENMFNRINSEKRECNGNTIHSGEHSYIRTVKWDEFIGSIDSHVNQALDIWRIRNEYKIRKNV